MIEEYSKYYMHGRLYYFKWWVKRMIVALVLWWTDSVSEEYRILIKLGFITKDAEPLHCRYCGHDHLISVFTQYSAQSVSIVGNSPNDLHTSDNIEVSCKYLGAASLQGSADNYQVKCVRCNKITGNWYKGSFTL